MRLKFYLFFTLTVFVLGSFFVVSAQAPEGWKQHAATSFESGDGTADNPYQIATAEQLAYLSVLSGSGYSNFLSAHYRLADNIDLSAYNWEPIGASSSRTHRFVGVFDGNNHSITGLNISYVVNDSPTGLFSIISDGAIVKNLNLTDVDIDVNSANVGALAGASYVSNESSATIYNVNVTGGTITGRAGSLFEYLASTGVGGIIGSVNLQTYIYDCSNAATVSAVAETQTGETTLSYNVGGIIGAAEYDTTVTGCKNTGNISADISVIENITTNVGVAGISGLYGTIKNASNTGNLTVTDNAERTDDLVDVSIGGIANKSSVHNSYNTGDISYSGVTSGMSSSIIGGISGGYEALYKTIVNCVNSGSYTTTNKNITFNAISIMSTHNSYWIESLSGNNALTMTASGSFDTAGNITTAPNSNGSSIANTLDGALNAWVTGNFESETIMPHSWNVSGSTVSHPASVDLPITIVNALDNGVDFFTVTLYSHEGRTLRSLDTSNGTVVLKNLPHGRYNLEIESDSMLTLTTVLEVTDNTPKQYKLITMGTPLIVDGNIIIDSIANLAHISYWVYNGFETYENRTIILNRDLDLSEYDWTPIGYLNPYDNYESGSSRAFMGDFDGNGHTISGINAKSIGTPIGLFGYTEEAKITNLTLESPTLSGYSLAAGALIGASANIVEFDPLIWATEISDVTVLNANIETGANGSIGQLNRRDSNVGGIVGVFAGGIMERCTVESGSVENLYDRVGSAGGIIGITTDYWSDYISSAMDTDIIDSVSFDELTNKAEVHSASYAGGIIGSFTVFDNSFDNTVKNSTNYGNITGYDYVGGILGYSWNMNNNEEYGLHFCENHGNILAVDKADEYTSDNVETNVGGIVGRNTGDILINLCTNNGGVTSDVQGMTRIGGIAGYTVGVVKNCTNNGKVLGIMNIETVSIGGLVGRFDAANYANGFLINNLNTAEVEINQNSQRAVYFLGGLVGYTNNSINSSSRALEIRNNYSHGALTLTNPYHSELEVGFGNLIGVIGYRAVATSNYAIRSQHPAIGLVNHRGGSTIPTVTNNAAFDASTGVLSAYEGAIPNTNNGYDEVYNVGGPIAGTLIDSLNAFVNDPTLSSVAGLFNWKIVVGKNDDQPILNAPTSFFYDITGDSIIDINDILEIIRPENYNKPTHLALNPKADINKDGFIDFLDVASIRNSVNFGSGKIFV